MMRLPAAAYPPIERPHTERPRAERYDAAAAQPHEALLERSSAAPSDELVDIYAAALIAVPLALFLRWLWP